MKNPNANDKWRTDIREGYRTKIIKTGNAIVTIHRPILSPEEQAKREDEVRRAMIMFLREQNKDSSATEKD